MNSSTTVRLGGLIIKFNLLIAVCVLLSVSLFMHLGFWQLDRAAEKRQMQLEAAIRQQEAPVPVETLLQAVSAGEVPLNQTRVSLQGHYLNEAPFLVLYQFFQGQPGYELVSPFQPEPGSPLILISRGWIAPSVQGGLPEIPAVEGEQRLVAQLHLPLSEVRAGEVSDQQWPVRLPRLNVPQAERLLGEPLFPYVLRLEAGQPGVQSRHWPPPPSGTRSHIAYALQWFGLGAIVALLTLLLSTNLLQLLRQRKHTMTGT